MNVLGLRRVEHRVPNLDDQPDSHVVSWDFTIDGITLNELHQDDNVGMLGGMDEEFAKENLLRLLGEPVPAPTFEIQWYRKPKRILGLFPRSGVPYAVSESAFRDGRVGLTYCFCGDMDCGVLSASIELTPAWVAWREVAFQVTYEDAPQRAAHAGLPTYVAASWWV
ncbi:hypothetical protein [Nocardioides alcanivorans]|uniref:hypothetical protein n=1 Tax=Nocardioides alcanivorans TaxID=2897352 RepID=UPI001F3C73F0|nr:hypothetical protein [Nocardioides alcanivorans]